MLADDSRVGPLLNGCRNEAINYGISGAEETVILLKSTKLMIAEMRLSTLVLKIYNQQKMINVGY